MIPTLIAAGFVIGFAMTRLWPSAILALVALGIAWGFVVVGLDGELGAFPGAVAIGLPNAAVGFVFGLGLRAGVRELVGRS